MSREARITKRLTVKLRGRTMPQAALRSTEALQALPMRPDWSRGRTISPSTRGDTTDSQGPLQRLLDGRSATLPTKKGFEGDSTTEPHTDTGRDSADRKKCPVSQAHRPGPASPKESCRPQACENARQ